MFILIRLYGGVIKVVDFRPQYENNWCGFIPLTPTQFVIVGPGWLKELGSWIT